MECRVSSEGLRDWGLGLRVWYLKSRFEGLVSIGLGCKVWGLGFRVQDIEFRFEYSMLTVQHLRLRVLRSARNVTHELYCARTKVRPTCCRHAPQADPFSPIDSSTEHFGDSAGTLK